MGMNKSDCRKTIRNLLEEIVMDLTEIMGCLHSTPSTRHAEMESLVIAKRRMIRLTEGLQMIHKHLVTLKYHHQNEQRGIRNPPKKFTEFMSFFSKLKHT